MSDTIAPRLTQFGADIDMVHFIDEDEHELSLGNERIEKTIIRTGAKLCILDPIQAYLGGANMNSANGVRPLMKQLGPDGVRHIACRASEQKMRQSAISRFGERGHSRRCSKRPHRRAH